MTSSRIRIQTAVLGFVLLPATVGVLAVHASQTCERLVRTYVSKPVRNRVSKATDEAWAKWRVAHPNWKPNPTLHRPKYVMSREEAVNKVEFACAVPTDPLTLSLLLNPAELGPPPEIVNLPPMKATLISFPDVVPPEVSEIPPGEAWPPFAPLIPPILGSSPGNTVPTLPVNPPPILGTVPEPPSIVLVVLGMVAVGFAFQLKRYKANSCR